MRHHVGMRLTVLLAATAVALSACTAAQGTPQLTGGATSPTPGLPSRPVSPSAAPTPPAVATPTTVATPSALPAARPPEPSPSAEDPTQAPSPTQTPGPTHTPTPTASPTPAVSSLIDPAALGGPAPEGAFVLGDSISLSAGIGPVLARLGYPVVGRVGQSASDAYLTEHLSSLTAQLAPAWVIELGTNNRGDAVDVARLSHWVDLVDSLRTPGARQKVLWITPHRPAAYVGGSSAWNLDAFNAELSRLAGEHRWLRVLDFDVLAKEHPEWFDADAAMHLHPDAAGQAALVALVAGADPRPAATAASVTDAGNQPTADATPAPEDLVFDNSAG
jgi:hypothetical protein